MVGKKLYLREQNTLMCYDIGVAANVKRRFWHRSRLLPLVCLLPLVWLERLVWLEPLGLVGESASMNQTWPAIVVGGLLLLFAGFVAGSEWLAYGQLCVSLEPNDPERLHSKRRFRRRMQVAIMIGLVGLLCPSAINCLSRTANPLAFAIFAL